MRTENMRNPMKFPSNLSKYKIYYAISFIIILLQILEWIIFRNFPYSLNSSAIFGSVNVPIVLIAIACLIFLVLTVIVKKFRFGLGLLFAGSLSNLLDRALYGGVVDYFKIPYIPTFNFADIIITFGAFLIILALIFGDKLFQRTNIVRE